MFCPEFFSFYRRIACIWIFHGRVYAQRSQKDWVYTWVSLSLCWGCMRRQWRKKTHIYIDICMRVDIKVPETDTWKKTPLFSPPVFPDGFEDGLTSPVSTGGPASLRLLVCMKIALKEYILRLASGCSWTTLWNAHGKILGTLLL